MKKIIIINCFIALIIGLSHISCKDAGSLRLVDNTGVKFSCKKTGIHFGEDSMIKINAVVENLTDTPKFFVVPSCNELEVNLVFKPDTYEVAILMHCNVSEPIIKVLAPKDSLAFIAHVLTGKDYPPLEEIGLDFREVNKYVSPEILRDNRELIDDVYYADTKPSNVIWK
ncbi:MAG: hypothetical protein AB8F95_00375 [Bacteroidia bacterium]